MAAAPSNAERIRALSAARDEACRRLGAAVGIGAQPASLRELIADRDLRTNALLAAYSSTAPSGDELAEECRQLVASRRSALLREIDRKYRRAKQAGKIRLALKLLEQAAKVAQEVSAC
jgi:hypothetical protein